MASKYAHTVTLYIDGPATEIQLEDLVGKIADLVRETTNEMNEVGDWDITMGLT